MTAKLDPVAPAIDAQDRSFAARASRRRDYGVVVTTRILRAFAFGFAQVLIGLHLEWLGLGPAAIGLAISISVLAGAATGIPAAYLSHRFGRRFVLIGVGILMSVSGLGLAVGSSQIAIVAGVTGMLGVGGLDLGPFLAVEQPMLAQAVSADHRNQAFARYSLSGALASSIGGLSAGLVTDVTRSRAFFVAFALIGLITAFLPLLLTNSVEEFRPSSTNKRGGAGISGLALLFLLDATGGGFVTSTLIAYWLHVRFDAGAQALGPFFAIANLLQAASYEVSGRIGTRIGLIKTMVFTNIPASLLLAVVPLTGSLGWALAVLLIRFSIGNMDVPLRQAYVVSIVPPERRSDAIALTSATRGLGLAIGPVLAGLSIQLGNLAAPFFVGSTLKVIYGLTLYGRYRSRNADHEIPRTPRH